MEKLVRTFFLDKVIDVEKHKAYYKRNYTTTDVNQKWSTDVSEFHIAAGKLYLSPIIVVHNREIVSYAISRSPNFKQVTNMLNIAIKKDKK